MTVGVTMLTTIDGKNHQKSVLIRLRGFYKFKLMTFGHHYVPAAALEQIIDILLPHCTPSLC